LRTDTIAAAGVTRTFRTSAFKDLTVLDNVMMGFHTSGARVSCTSC